MNLRFSRLEHNSPLYHQTRELRDAVLRRPLNIDVSIGEPETERDHFHLAAQLENEIVACLVLVPQENRTLKMRQVAVAPEFQNRGIGGELVRFAETVARENGFHLITLHARQVAVSFYERLGYESVGEPFIEVTLPHRKMQKSL